MRMHVSKNSPWVKISRGGGNKSPSGEEIITIFWILIGVILILAVFG